MKVGDEGLFGHQVPRPLVQLVKFVGWGGKALFYVLIAIGMGITVVVGILEGQVGISVSGAITGALVWVTFTLWNLLRGGKGDERPPQEEEQEILVPVEWVCSYGRTNPTENFNCAGCSADQPHLSRTPL